MNSIQITKIGLEQWVSLQEIGRLTFFETFSPFNTAENMTAYLEEGFSEAKLTAELQNSGSEFFFARQNETVIGYLKINFGQAQTETQTAPALEIERIYVLQEFHGKQVGQLLFEKAIQIATNKNVDYVWLGVWEENKRAIRFYTKNGFVAFDSHIFFLGKEEQTDIMMKLPMRTH